VEGIPVTQTFGFMLNLHYGYGCLKVESLIPGSFVFDTLRDKQLEGLFLLEINGIALRSISDVTVILDDVFNRDEEQTHAILTGFTFLLGKLDLSDTDADTLLSEAHYHAVSCSVFSLCLEAVSADADNDMDVSDDLACLFMDMEHVNPEFIADVWSILITASDPQCPTPSVPK
jgi:hypothetical protein